MACTERGHGQRPCEVGDGFAAPARLRGLRATRLSRLSEASSYPRKTMSLRTGTLRPYWINISWKVYSPRNKERQRPVGEMRQPVSLPGIESADDQHRRRGRQAETGGTAKAAQVTHSKRQA